MSQPRTYNSADVLGVNAVSQVTQTVGRTTGVTINALCGAITSNNTTLLAETAADFVVTNSMCNIADTVVVSVRSGVVGVMTEVFVTGVADGSFSLRTVNGNPAAGTSETGSIIINFHIIKAVQ